MRDAQASDFSAITSVFPPIRIDLPIKKRCTPHCASLAKAEENPNSGGWEAQLGWRLSDLVYCESHLQQAAVGP
jgi:hypothetical protein